MGFKSEVVHFDVHERLASMTTIREQMIGFAPDGVTSFTVAPLRMIANGGAPITRRPGHQRIHYRERVVATSCRAGLHGPSDLRARRPSNHDHRSGRGIWQDYSEGK